MGFDEASFIVRFGAISAAQSLRTIEILERQVRPHFDRQLKERVVGMMLDGDLKAGDALPRRHRVRTIARRGTTVVNRHLKSEWPW